MVAGEQNYRQPNTDINDIHHNLTRYADVETTHTHVGEGKASTLKELTKYLPSQDVNTLLSRSYKVRDFEWGPTHAQGVAVTSSFLLPSALADRPFISNIVSRYAYFRCSSVTLTFRVQSTPFQYGALVISHIYDTRSCVDRTNYFEQRCQNRPMFLSAMSGESVEVTIPWNSPEDWYATDFLTTALDGALGEVSANVLAPLLSIGDTVEPLTVSVYAKFNDPEVAGPNIRTPFAPEDQSIAAEAVDKAIKGVMEGGNSTAVQQVVNMADVVSTLLPVLDKPASAQGNTISALEYGKDMPLVKGQSFGTKLAANPDAVIDPMANVFDSGDHNLYDLCRLPSYNDYTLIERNLTPGTVFWSDNVTPYKLSTPKTEASGTYYVVPYVTYFSLPFRYWRGSLTWHFQFFTSKFVSARVRITWLPHMGSADIKDRTGDVISRVVDVNGDTHVSVTIPYLNATLWQYMTPAGQPQSSFNLGTIQAELVSSMVSSVASPSIHMTTWFGAGPDYQLGYYDASTSLDDADYIWQYPNDQSIWELANHADPIIENHAVRIASLSNAETYESVVELAKRFCEIGVEQDPETLQDGVYMESFNYLPTAVQGRQNDMVHHFVRPFVYYRGALRFKLMRSKARIAEPWHVTRFMEVATKKSGPSIAQSPGNMGNQVELEAPFFSRTPYVPTGVPNSNSGWILPTLTSSATDFSDAKAFYAVGDDFQVFGLFAPPMLFAPL